MRVMEEENTGDASILKKRKISAEAGPYVLRTLLEDVPLSAEGAGEDVKVNCVEILGMTTISA